MWEWYVPERRGRAPESVSYLPSPRTAPTRGRVLELQRAVGNQAVSRLLQRIAVESWELEMRPGPGTQKLGHDVVIYARKSPTSEFEPVNDSTKSDYLDAAEASLGGLEPLNILVKWEVMPRANLPKPWWRAHLIAAEFGGQKKYRPFENVRYHPETLEQGEWQTAESRVKEQTHGKLFAESKECGGAAALAGQIAKAINMGADAQFVTKLAETLKAADYVAETVSFNFVPSDATSQPVTGRWSNQNALLKVIDGVDPKRVYSALAEMQSAGLLAADAITISPQAKMPDQAKAIASLQELKEYLTAIYGKLGTNRKTAVVRTLSGPFKGPEGNWTDEVFTAQLAKLPEIASRADKPKLTNVRMWLTLGSVEALFT